MSRIEINPQNVERVRAAAESLLGTSSSLDDSLADAFGIDDLTIIDLPVELAQEIDDIAAECEACGWWVEPGEIINGVCGDCRDDSEDDE